MEYACQLTTHGSALMAACVTLERALCITRVAFGSGAPEEGTPLAEVHALCAPAAPGAVAAQKYEGDRLYLTLQYANSEHPQTPAFTLSEFMLYAEDPVTGQETDLLYGTLGAYRQCVPAWESGMPPSVFSFPLTIAVTGEAAVSVRAPSGLATAGDVRRLVDELAARRRDLTIPAAGWTACGGAFAVQCDIPAPGVTAQMVPLVTVLPEDMAAADACGLAPCSETRAQALRVFARCAPSQAIRASLALIYDAGGYDAVKQEGEG